jgi:flagellar biosynthesis protein FlhG
MADQAQGLRDLADRAFHTIDATAAAVVVPRSTARTIAVTSGKGGVGKTNLSANLAIALGGNGTRVVVLDADVGLANTHMLLGVSPRYQLDDVACGTRSVSEILCPVYRNVELVAGASDITEAGGFDGEQAANVVAELARLDHCADVVLVDTGAGLSSTVLAFILAVDEVVVVTTPEPTAIADAYATMKVVARENRGTTIHLVVNMARDEADATAAVKRLRLVCRRFLGIDISYLGWVPQDAAVPRAVRAHKPFALAQPACPAALAVWRIADALGYHGGSRGGATGFVSRVMGFLSAGRPGAGKIRETAERTTKCPAGN